MYTCLSPAAIGIRVTMPEAINLASQAGFEGLAPDVKEAADPAYAERLPRLRRELVR